jgi:peptidoglycan/xylan/chitin deacetylase (PgdA/CDA1 family)
MLVLCYHAVSEDWGAPLSVSPKNLERQLALLIRLGYTGMTFTDAVVSRPGRRVIAVTFDDGFASVVQLGLPILSRLGLPGTLFVPTDFPQDAGLLSWPGVDRWLGGPHEQELRSVSWSDVRELRDSGWEIGSHTRSHPRLTHLDDQQLREELRGSRERCEQEVGTPCRSLAYPYGDVDRRVIRATQDAGFEAAAGLSMRPLGPRGFRWPRAGVYHRDSLRRFAVKVSPIGAGARAVKGRRRGGS